MTSTMVGAAARTPQAAIEAAFTTASNLHEWTSPQERDRIAGDMASLRLAALLGLLDHGGARWTFTTNDANAPTCQGRGWFVQFNHDPSRRGVAVQLELTAAAAAAACANCGGALDATGSCVNGGCADVSTKEHFDLSLTNMTARAALVELATDCPLGFASDMFFLVEHADDHKRLRAAARSKGWQTTIQRDGLAIEADHWGLTVFNPEEDDLGTLVTTVTFEARW